MIPLHPQAALIGSMSVSAWPTGSVTERNTNDSIW